MSKTPEQVWLGMKCPAPRWLTRDEQKLLIPVGRYFARDLNGHWYFWDETGAECHGPYFSKREAERALEDYGASL